MKKARVFLKKKLSSLLYVGDLSQIEQKLAFQVENGAEKNIADASRHGGNEISLRGRRRGLCVINNYLYCLLLDIQPIALSWYHFITGRRH